MRSRTHLCVIALAAWRLLPARVAPAIGTNEAIT
jgi:hypothetical protein